MNASTCSRRIEPTAGGMACSARKASRPRTAAEYVANVAGLMRWAVR